MTNKGNIFQSAVARRMSSNSKRSIAGSFSVIACIIVALAGLFLLRGHGDFARLSKNDVHSYPEEVLQLGQKLSTQKAVSNLHPDSWVYLEKVGETYLERAQLTGEFDDYVAAQTILNKAFSLAGKKGGPVLTRAKLNYSIHRLPDVDADLVEAESALLVNAETIDTIHGLRADVKFNTGHYAQSKYAYAQLESNNPSVKSATRLAHYYAHAGYYVEAERWFQKATERVSGQSPHLRAWLHLQLGILDLERGRLNDALVHYQAGLESFPGFWLVEEHIAEIDVLQGRDAQAEEKYRDLITRTGSPLFMSALADILAARSGIADQDESLRWREKAGRNYSAIIESMPELMSGHALEHFLHSGDTRRALQLAQDNYQLRPNGQAGLLLIQSHAALGQTSQALTLLESIFNSSFRSAELHATAAVLFEALDDDYRASMHDGQARAINPIAIDDISWLKDSVLAARN